MVYESCKTFKTKLLIFFSNEVIECNYNIGEYTVDLYFPEYNIAVQIYEVNEEILNVKKFLKNTNCMLINVNLDKNHFDSFTEIIKIKNFLFDVIKNKLSKHKKLNFTLNDKLKKIHDIFVSGINFNPK